MILFVFRLEPINYCIMEGRQEEAIEHMRKVYRKKNPDDPRTI